MQTAQGTMLESLRSVETFLDAHADKLGDVVKTGARQKLTEAIAALDVHASDQTGGALASQGATQKKLSLRQALLRDHMAKIARIAAADLPNVPELEPLRMPRGKPTVEKLAALAAGMAQDRGAIRRGVHLGGTAAGLHRPAQRGDRRHDWSDQRTHVESRSPERRHRRPQRAAERRPQDRPRPRRVREERAQRRSVAVAELEPRQARPASHGPRRERRGVALGRSNARSTTVTAATPEPAPRSARVDPLLSRRTHVAFAGGLSRTDDAPSRWARARRARRRHDVDRC